jgi:hypothetical protein
MSLSASCQEQRSVGTYGTSGDAITDCLAATLVRPSGHPPGTGARLDRATHRSPVRGPACVSWRRLLLAWSSEPGGENSPHCLELVLRRRAFDNDELQLLIIGAAHSGMLPCFFGGKVWRLVRSSRSTRVISPRVSCGEITAST